VRTREDTPASQLIQLCERIERDYDMDTIQTTFGNTTSAKCYVPDGLDAELSALGKDWWKAAFLFDLFWKKQFDRLKGRLRFVGRWVPLYSGFLKKMLGNDYATTMNTMIERGWIERDERRHHANFGGEKTYSTHYRLGQSFWKARFHQVDTKSKTLARHRRRRRKEKEDNLPRSYRYVLRTCFENQFSSRARR
jgi:hypothetical protein